MTPAIFHTLLFSAALLYIAKVPILQPAGIGDLAENVMRAIAEFDLHLGIYPRPEPRPIRLTVTGVNFLRLAGLMLAAAAFYSAVTVAR